MQAMSEERVSENFPFTRTSNLKRQINYSDYETFRKLVQRSRKKISQLAERAGDPPPSIEAVIESSQWHGYRLNPTQVRIVTLSDIRVRRNTAAARQGQVPSVFRHNPP